MGRTRDPLRCSPGSGFALRAERSSFSPPPCLVPRRRHTICSVTVSARPVPAAGAVCHCIGQRVQPSSSSGGLFIFESVWRPAPQQGAGRGGATTPLQGPTQGGAKEGQQNRQAGQAGRAAGQPPSWQSPGTGCPSDAQSLERSRATARGNPSTTSTSSQPSAPNAQLLD